MSGRPSVVAQIIMPVAAICALGTIGAAATGHWLIATGLACSTVMTVAAMRAVW